MTVISRYVPGGSTVNVHIDLESALRVVVWVRWFCSVKFDVKAKIRVVRKGEKAFSF